jgi:hypothetical protein
VTGPLIDANNYVTLDYRLNPTPSMAWTSLAHTFNSAVYDRVKFPITASATLVG